MPDSLDDIFKKKFSDFESDPLSETKEKIFAQWEQQEAPRYRGAFSRAWAGRKTYARYAGGVLLVGLLGAVGLSLWKPKGDAKEQMALPARTNTEARTPQQHITQEGDTLAKPRQPEAEKHLPSSKAAALLQERTENGKRWKVLSDSSHVYLNTFSTLRYPSRFAEGGRQVYLEGEAYFQVRKMDHRPFVVHTKHARIEVLGTSFYVTQGPNNRVEVTVESGTVRFTEKENQANHLVLTKGMKAVLEPGKPLTKKTWEQGEPTNDLAWKTGTLEFRRSPLKEVIEDLSSYFGTEIHIGDSQMWNCHFTGKFEQPERIEDVLDVVSLSLHGTYTYKDSTYLLTSKGCH